MGLTSADKAHYLKIRCIEVSKKVVQRQKFLRGNDD